MNFILLHTGVMPADVNTFLTFLPCYSPGRLIFRLLTPAPAATGFSVSRQGLPSLTRRIYSGINDDLPRGPFGAGPHTCFSAPWKILPLIPFGDSPIPSAQNHSDRKEKFSKKQMDFPVSYPNRKIVPKATGAMLPVPAAPSRRPAPKKGLRGLSTILNRRDSWRNFY